MFSDISHFQNKPKPELYKNLIFNNWKSTEIKGEKTNTTKARQFVISGLCNRGW